MLCFSKFPGNIGRLRNLIQVSCAEAYFKHGKEDDLLISEAETDSSKVEIYQLIQ